MPGSRCVGKSYYNSLNQLAVEVFRTTDNDIEHNFEFGQILSHLFTVSGDRKIKYFNFSGTVSYVDGDRMGGDRT